MRLFCRRFHLQERMVREHVQRMLQAVNLEGFIDRQTHTLSGGQKQRVAIAGALAQCPKVRLFAALAFLFHCAARMLCGYQLRGIAARRHNLNTSNYDWPPERMQRNCGVQLTLRSLLHPISALYMVRLTYKVFPSFHRRVAPLFEDFTVIKDGICLIRCCCWMS